MPPCSSAHTGRPAIASNSSLAMASGERTNQQRLPPGAGTHPAPGGGARLQRLPASASPGAAGPPLTKEQTLFWTGSSSVSSGDINSTSGGHGASTSLTIVNISSHRPLKIALAWSRHHWGPGAGPVFLEKGGNGTATVNTAAPVARAESPREAERQSLCCPAEADRSPEASHSFESSP